MKQPIPDPPPLAHRLQTQTGRPFLFWHVPVPQFCEQQAPIHSFAATSLKPQISMRAQTEKRSLSRLARSNGSALTLIMIAYPDTNQFHDVIESIRRYPYRYKIEQGKNYPKLKFTGTVKLHGANAAIVYQKELGYHCQSRHLIVSPEMDNHGFAHFMYPLAEKFLQERVLINCSMLQKHYDRGNTIVIYGEWCGRNIQKNVALCGVRKMFVIFKIRIGESKPPVWIDPKHWSNLQWSEQLIYNIFDFSTYDIEIDFNQPQLAQSKLVEITKTVENECPVGMYFNQKGYGEGIVWTEWLQSYGNLSFKVKGEMHAVTKGGPMAPIAAERFDSIRDFVEYACTDNRMNQALDYLCEIQLEIEMENFDTFLEWIIADIKKEETNTIKNSNLNLKDVMCAISRKATVWFEEHFLNNSVQ
ncbi:unnamed protein product [Adineta ricciae]|uniref:RNA ligase domain-containing protein n=1 Tax=Adineta ricciae TaxID=249248 RepID=A0A814B8C4_ADIRI|nr:unnamed protein product [Adineta ricciae]